MNSNDLVLVTGANGFIASWIVYDILKTGARVRGTVRDPNNLSKVQHLKNLPGSERLELVALDLLTEDEESFARAVEGVTLIAHTASPFPSVQPENEDDLIKPAVQGTVGILKAALKCTTCRAVVVTSSVVACGESTMPAGNHKADENTWTDISIAPAYPKSKTLAEKAAWELYRENKPKWTLTTVNPGFVLGPSLSKEVTTSTGLFVRLLNGGVPLAPRISFPMVDVRDVSLAHVAVLSLPAEKVNERRFILAENTYWMVQVGRALREEFTNMGYGMLPKHEAPSFALWLVSFFDNQIKTILPGLDSFTSYDSAPSRDILGIKYINFNKTVVDSGHSVIYHGLVPQKIGYSPPKQDWIPLDS